ncbi:MAG: hypothetical protein V1810_03165 [Candidatus Beckwithbacteria bacterium]
MDLNLLSEKIKKVRDKQKLKRLAWKLVVIGWIVLALLIAGLSAYGIGINMLNKSLEQKTSQAKNQITQLEDVESKQVFLVSKITAFEDLLKQQEKHQRIAEAIFSLIPDGTSLKGFKVNENGTISLSGNVPSWPKLYELIRRIKEPTAGQARIIEAGVQRISFNNKAEINFSIFLTLGFGAAE